MVNTSKISMKKVKEVSSVLREKLDEIDTLIEQKEDKNKICQKLVDLEYYINRDIISKQSNEWKGDYLAEMGDIIGFEDPLY